MKTYKPSINYKEYTKFYKANLDLDRLADLSIDIVTGKEIEVFYKECNILCKIPFDHYDVFYPEIMKLPGKDKKQYKKDVCKPYNTLFVPCYLKKLRYPSIINKLNK